MKIIEYKKKNGTIVYRANIYLGVDSITGKKARTSVSGRTKKELKNNIKLAKYDFQANGETLSKKVQVKTFKDLTDMWLVNYKLTLKPQSYNSTVSMLNKHILPYFGKMKLDKITSSDVQTFINSLSKKTINYVNARSIISRILQHGVLLQLIQHNPARDVVLPRKQKKGSDKVKFIEKDDLKKFLDYIEKDKLRNYKTNFNYVLYKLLLATGLRIGEACALEWSDIDLINGTINIDKTYSKSIRRLSTTKSKSGTRLISIDQATVNMLKLYQVRQRQLFHEVGGEAPEVVFATPTRKYQNTAIRQDALDRRLKEIGCPRFTFHAFRHTHASLLLNAGISYKELQYRLGHATLAMTMDIYSHLSKDKEKEAVSYYEKAINSL
ncbi:site-specific integrase [Streptococcus uberis]|uniref:tyrosine-type recombinase/integrase n=1 Tax=Streptococcus uberis TaxID=1349 RepID=UPI001FF3AFD9|nr:site-specific integrase [Streptococcus uberis]MCK1227012.1 site-specific integrase [Streptococcus uberis]